MAPVVFIYIYIYIVLLKTQVGTYTRFLVIICFGFVFDGYQISNESNVYYIVCFIVGSGVIF